MKATEIFHGMICYVTNAGGSIVKKFDDEGNQEPQQVSVLRPGVEGMSGRRDSSEIVYVNPDAEGRYVQEIFKDDDYNRKWNPEKIGKPRIRKVQNRRLMSLRVGDEQLEVQRKIEERQQHVRELMERTRNEMIALLEPHGISSSGVTVQAKFHAEEDAAEVTSVRISGEDNIERMIQVFRDFKEIEEKT